MSETSGIPEVLARPGYDETWTGLYLETFRIYGMHMLFPTLPEKIDPNDPADLIIELSKVVIGFDDGGVSGSLKVQMHTPANDPRVIRGAGFVVELERGNLIRCEVELTLRLERIAHPNGTHRPRPADHRQRPLQPRRPAGMGPGAQHTEHRRRGAAVVRARRRRQHRGGDRGGAAGR